MSKRHFQPIYIQDCGFNSAMGSTPSSIHECLSGLTDSNMVEDTSILNTNRSTVIGRIKGSLPEIPTELKAFDSRNNQLALSAVKQIESSVNSAIEKYGSSRIAVIIGTTTSGISDGEIAYEHKLRNHTFPNHFHYKKQELGDISKFISAYFGISGPCYSISTACSSSGRVYITAQHLLRNNVVDAVIVGGVDTICRLTLNGFNSLEALSDTLCKPFDRTRNGINIGESAALMLLSNEQAEVALLGAGDSSDAYHISAPHPDGAERAMRKALDNAGLYTDDIGYINAHGTATILNDSMESEAIYRVFKDYVPVSSTKTLTGHTLGASSATEAAISWHILKYDLNLPIQSCHDKADDISIPLVTKEIKLREKAILSNSFAFGGNNVSLIFGYPNV